MRWIKIINRFLCAIHRLHRGVYYNLFLIFRLDRLMVNLWYEESIKLIFHFTFPICLCIMREYICIAACIVYHLFCIFVVVKMNLIQSN